MKLPSLRFLSLAAICLLTASLPAWSQAVGPANDVEDLSSPSLGSSHLNPDPPELVDKDEEPDYISEWVTVRWRGNDPIYLYVVRPVGVRKPPVVIYLYDYPAETDVFRDDDWCRHVTAGGYAAVGFVPAMNGHRFHDRALKEWFVSELQESLAKSAHDVQMVLNYLGERGDVDLSQVGVFGAGSGATIAIAAASADSRIKALDLVDPWGDWPTWFSKSEVVPAEERPNYLKPEFLKRLEAFDPVKLLPNLATPHIRLNQSATNSSTPKEARDRIQAALRPSAIHQILGGDRQFDPVTASGQSGFDWIKRQLQAQDASKPSSEMMRAGSNGEPSKAVHQ